MHVCTLSQCKSNGVRSEGTFYFLIRRHGARAVQGIEARLQGVRSPEAKGLGYDNDHI